MKEIVLQLEGLNCAGCAAKIEKLTKDIEGVDNASLDFVSKNLKVDIAEEESWKAIVDEIKSIVNRLEPDVKIIEKDNNNFKVSHNHENIANKDIYRILLSGILFLLPILLKLDGMARLGIYLLAYIIIGSDIIIRAFRNLIGGQPFDENFLMTIATVGAFMIGEYPEGVAVMLFYQIGELFQGMAVNHSRKSISSLLDIRSDYANLERNGELIVVDPQEVHIGDNIVIKPGEKVPLDGLVIQGISTVDTSNITGESVPRRIKAGDRVLSGFVNNEGLLTVQVEKEFTESTVSKILDLVENASSKKAATEKFITKFARYYTPAVVFIALVIGLFPPILLGYDFKDWAYRAFVFLVISCPCALVISIPLGFFGGIGGASKIGVLIKGGNLLEALNEVDTMVFDKTGTLTQGTFHVTQIYSYNGFSEEDILELAAHSEYYSNHPIGQSIIRAYGKEIDNAKIEDYKEISGKGIKARIDGSMVLVGNKKLFEDNNIDIDEKESIGSVAYVGKDGVHVGTIVVSDQLKENIAAQIQSIKAMSVKETIMLSGDREETASKVGQVVGIDRVYGNLLPEDKVRILEQILSESKGKVAYVGDGVNDAPVLARADIGIAMGGLGSDAAIEASDIVIMTDEIGKIATGMKIAKNTKKIVVQNIILALSIKLVVLILGGFGKASMWEAVFADVGVSIIAILNSIRALKVEG
ncbi:MAG: cadmium-translocating P-type ATPase [Tissierellia bacterium]|nr:cadmium-translocating P-type ATPase [Tissierellia bacterium]